MKSAPMRQLAVSLHLNDGQSLETAARNTRMSRRTLTRFLAYVEDNGEGHYAPVKWNTGADSFLKCPDLRSVVLFAVEQWPEAFLHEVSDFVTNLDQLLREDVVICPSSVSGILAANGLTRKVIEIAFITQNELDRARPSLVAIPERVQTHDGIRQWRCCLTERRVCMIASWGPLQRAC